MTNKSDLLWIIGVLVTIAGIVVGLFIPEVRRFLGIEKTKKEERRNELQVTRIENTIKDNPTYGLNYKAELMKEEEADCINLAYKHGHSDVRAKAAKELIKKSRNQNVIINLAYNHGHSDIKAEAAKKLIEKSDDKNVIRNLSAKHGHSDIRAEAADRLMNWHFKANNYFS